MDALLSVFRSRRDHEALGDEALVALARRQDESAVRALVKRYNQQLFRTARGVVGSDSEAEDVVQEAYVRAFTSLDGFRGDSAFSTWLTRITLNAAFGRLRKRRPVVELSELDTEGRVIMFPTSPPQPDPESEAGREQVRQALEKAIDMLPEPFRLVFILRDVQGLSADETASLLSIKPQTVKTRLYRARRLMRVEIEKALAPRFSEVFPFDGDRCAHMAESVVTRLREAVTRRSARQPTA